MEKPVQEVSKVVSEMRETTADLRALQNDLLNRLYFQELLEMAEDACLTRKPDYAEPEKLEGEAAIIAHLGTRGLRTVCELSDGILTEAPKSNLNEKGAEKSKKRITASAPIRYVDSFTDPTHFDLLAKAEAFGARIIEESFRVLGQDAYEKARLFGQTQSLDEQLSIIGWLNRRLDTLTHPANPEPQGHYNPIRLSPKLTGIYPNHHLTPTCLGVSTIATSFFKRAGADTLHGAVIQTRSDAVAIDTYNLIGVLPTNLDRLQCSLPEAVEQSIERVAQQATEYAHRPDAHHAVVYTRLVDGSWAQFDPNFHATTRLDHPEENHTLDKRFDELTALKHLVPGLELSTVVGNDLFNDVALLCMFNLEEQSPETMQGLVEAASVELDSDELAPFSERLFAQVQAIFFDESETQSNLFLAALNETLLRLGLKVYGHFDESHLHNVFHKMFTKYVLWDESPDVVLAKIRKDQSYKANRLEDIKLLPILMLVSVARDHLGFMSVPSTGHKVVELGLPEQRIGLAVLSDFAAYTNSPLPPSFWISHWTSDVALIENIERASLSDRDKNLLFNNLVHYRKRGYLTSHRNYDIISSFIKSTRPKQEGGDNDGEQGRAGAADG